MAPNIRLWKRQAEPIGVTEDDTEAQTTTGFPLDHFKQHHHKHHISTTTDSSGIITPFKFLLDAVNKTKWL